MRPVFDPSKPYTRTFGDDAAKMPYFQNGLYFASAGHAVDCDHNRLMSKQHRVNYELGPAPEAVKQQEEMEKREATMSDDELRLRAMPPMEVYSTASRLRDTIDNDPDYIGEPDNYLPRPDEVEDNIAFILKHTAQS